MKKRWMILALLIFSFGGYAGWELRSQVENNPVVKVAKWVAQINPFNNKSSDEEADDRGTSRKDRF